MRASILSQMRDEAAIARGEDTLTILWDMEKFYDNTCIEKLIHEACRLGLPDAGVQARPHDAHGTQVAPHV